MDRKASGSKSNTTPPSTRCVHAARRTLETLNILLKLYGYSSPTFINFISFYPFVAFFSLYHHILFTLQKQPRPESAQHESLESDISLMEDLATLLDNLASSQEEFHLVANAVTTLTKASRRLLPPSASVTPSTFTPSETHNLRKCLPRPMEQTPAEPLHGPADLSFPWTSTEGTTWPRFEAGFQQNGVKTPLLFVESMESDLFGRNWHQSWWDQ